MLSMDYSNIILSGSESPLERDRQRTDADEDDVDSDEELRHTLRQLVRLVRDDMHCKCICTAGNIDLMTMMTNVDAPVVVSEERAVQRQGRRGLGGVRG